MISIITLAVVFILIAVRQVGNVKFRIQNAEKKGGVTITFLEFVKIGVPLTIINVAVYWLFLRIF